MSILIGPHAFLFSQAFFLKNSFRWSPSSQLSCFFFFLPDPSYHTKESLKILNVLSETILTDSAPITLFLVHDTWFPARIVSILLRISSSKSFPNNSLDLFSSLPPCFLPPTLSWPAFRATLERGFPHRHLFWFASSFVPPSRIFFQLSPDDSLVRSQPSLFIIPVMATSFGAPCGGPLLWFLFEKSGSAPVSPLFSLPLSQESFLPREIFVVGYCQELLPKDPPPRVMLGTPISLCLPHVIR